MFCFAVPLLAAMLSAAAPEDPRKLFESAAQALSSGNLAAAEAGFLQVLEIQPRNIGALGNLGVVYNRMGRPAEAVDVYARALKLAPHDPLLHLNIALAYFKQDDYASAKPHLQRVLAFNPKHAQAHELLLTAMVFTGEVESALPALERLEQTGKPATLYLLAVGYLKTGAKGRAAAALDNLFRKVGPAEAHLLSGRAYYESTLFEQAVAELEQAKELNLDLPGVHRELGKVYVSLRRSDEARNSLQEAIRRDAGDAEARYFLGALLVQEGDVGQGTKLLESARAARPNFWGTYYYLGKAKLDTGDTASALTLLRRAAELNPDEAPVHYLLARTLRKVGDAGGAKAATAKYLELEAARRAREQRGSMGAR